jgi:hypothetical protein
MTKDIVKMVEGITKIWVDAIHAIEVGNAEAAYKGVQTMIYEAKTLKRLLVAVTGR